MVVIFSLITCCNGSRTKENPSETRGTYLWVNLLKTPLAETTKRLIDETEHLSKDEFHLSHYTHITNSIPDIRSI